MIMHLSRSQMTGKYLIVPEGESVPEDMDKDITVLQQPIQNIYLAASAAMDMFVSLDALDSIRFSSLKADGWYIDEPNRQWKPEIFFMLASIQPRIMKRSLNRTAVWPLRIP